MAFFETVLEKCIMTMAMAAPAESAGKKRREGSGLPA
mgnify:CR=1 FL=1